MSTSGWRTLLLTLCAFTLVELGLTCWMQAAKMAAIPGLVCNCGIPGDVAVEQTTAMPLVHRLVFGPENPLVAAGLRSGDLVDLRPLAPSQRYRFSTRFWWRGERVTLPIIHNGRTKSVNLVPQPFGFPIEWWIANVGLAWMVIFAAVIAWRRANSVEARVLALLLICYSAGLTFESQNWATPWPAFDMALNTVSALVYNIGIALLATHAMLFAQPASLLRRVLTLAAYAVAIVGGVLYAAHSIGAWTGVPDFAGAWYQGFWGQLFMNVLTFALPVLCSALGIAAARGIQRDRIAWAEVPLAYLFAMQLVQMVPQMLDSNFVQPRVLEALGNSAMFVAPLGLTYSLLNRRILDTGFAINRAMVFSSVSLLIVGAFVLFEWILSEWFSSASHTANLAISAAFALTLGLSVRAIHTRVDRTLDSVFFRKRHDDERALRGFAREAAYVTDPQTLLERTEETLKRHADASAVSFALEQDGFAPAGEDDRAIVALRTWHDVVDLHDVQTALPGEFAFPMVARGRLVGALVVGPKTSGESYAPDESDAITSMAHGVGGALDILQSRDGRGHVTLETLQNEITTAIREGFAELAQRLENLEGGRRIV